MKPTRTIDTNILVRLLAKDDQVQWERVAALLRSYRFHILPTVLLETEWVLRSRYHLGRSHVVGLLKGMLASDGFLFLERDAIARAIALFEAGLDFADAMHVCLTPEGETFVTFDRDLVRLAKRHMNSAGVELAI